MTVVKAKLKVVLQADDVVVAETEDAILWQKVLVAINHAISGTNAPPDTSLVPPAPPTQETQAASNGTSAAAANGRESHGVADAVDKFAQRLGVARELVEGACSPSTEAPFLHLDMHCWEEMKSQVPARGPGSMPPIAVAGTLLSLWFKAADLGNPTQAQAQAVLETLHLRDRNPTRGLDSSNWLQRRAGGAILLNPAQVTKAVNIAKSFCTQQWKADAANAS